jgi:hypothetical protein
LKRPKLRDIKPVDERHRLFLKLMINYRVSRETIVEKTGVDRGNASRYIHEGFGDIFWDKLQDPFKVEFASILNLEKHEAEKKQEDAEKKEVKRREENRYTYQAINEEQEEKWDEQKKINSGLQVQDTQIKTRVESLEERVAFLEKQLRLRDTPPGEKDIPSSDFLKERDLLDENPIDKHDLPGKKGKRKSKGE